MTHDKNTLFKQIYLIGRAIYHKTPFWLRFIFWPAQLMQLIDILRFNMWIITGKENESKQDLTIIYAGSEKNKNYVNTLTFNSSFKENYLGKAWLWKIAKIVKKRNYNCSILIVEVHKALTHIIKKKTHFYVPCWIMGEVDFILEQPKHIKNKSLKSDFRRIRKNKLDFEITNELSELHDFYHNMYVPYISKSHGDSAVVTSYYFIKKKFRQCDLLLIKKEKKYISGILISYSEKVPRLWYIGVKDANNDHIKDGAIGALYYYSVLYLKQKGYKKVNFGMSRPFLKDGVLQYKKKWGLKIYDSDKIGFLIKPLSKTEGTKEFFLNNPFIFLENKKFNVAIFVEKEQSKQDFEKIYKDYFITGVSNVYIYRFGEGDYKIPELIPSELSDRMTISCAESLFKKITSAA